MFASPVLTMGVKRVGTIFLLASLFIAAYVCAYGVSLSKRLAESQKLATPSGFNALDLLVQSSYHVRPAAGDSKADGGGSGNSTENRLAVRWPRQARAHDTQVAAPVARSVPEANMVHTFSASSATSCAGMTCYITSSMATQARPTPATPRDTRLCTADLGACAHVHHAAPCIHITAHKTRARRRPPSFADGIAFPPAWAAKSTLNRPEGPHVAGDVIVPINVDELYAKVEKVNLHTRLKYGMVWELENPENWFHTLDDALHMFHGYCTGLGLCEYSDTDMQDSTLLLLTLQ